jgi:hypothetical protein
MALLHPSIRQRRPVPGADAYDWAEVSLVGGGVTGGFFVDVFGVEIATQRPLSASSVLARRSLASAGVILFSRSLAVRLPHTGHGDELQVVGFNFLSLIADAVVDNLYRDARYRDQSDGTKSLPASMNTGSSARPVQTLVTERCEAREHSFHSKADDIGIARTQTLCQSFDLAKICALTRNETACLRPSTLAALRFSLLLILEHRMVRGAW